MTCTTTPAPLSHVCHDTGLSPTGFCSPKARPPEEASVTELVEEDDEDDTEDDEEEVDFDEDDEDDDTEEEVDVVVALVSTSVPLPVNFTHVSLPLVPVAFPPEWEN